MRGYINHYKIESKRPGEDWEHVIDVYPKYQWVIRRLWYYLWLVKRPRIVNERAAGIEAVMRLAKFLDPPQTDEQIRILTWVRYSLYGLCEVEIAEIQ
jgi:hypothetical protein